MFSSVAENDIMLGYLSLMFGLVFVQNFVLSQFLGLCPFLGVSKKQSIALGMGLAVVFVMVMSCIATFFFYFLVLVPLEAGEYLDIASFILIIAALTQLVELVIKKHSPSLYEALGIYLPLLSTNCAVLGATQLKIAEFGQKVASGSLSFWDAFAQNTIIGIFGGLGFTLAIFLMASLRERLDTAPVPDSLKGTPLAFIVTACMALAFFGFAGII